MQKAYLTALCEIAENDKNVILLLADSGTAYDGLFKNSFPDQILDFGIAEENMVMSAAGMASCGKVPFVFTAGAFLSYRSMEFIRDDLCFQNNNVKVIGVGSGLGWSTLGPTHHTTEEIAVLRSLPNLMILSPSCPSMAFNAVKAAYDHVGPVYIRLGMGGEKELYAEESNKNIFKNTIMKQGKDVVIFFTGTIGVEVIKAANKLEELGIGTEVVDICSIKPLDRNNIVEELKTHKVVVSVEEHNVIGGIGSAIAEVIADDKLIVDFLKIGLNDCFAKGYGTQDEVRMQNGLDSESIAQRVFEFCKNKF